MSTFAQKQQPASKAESAVSAKHGRSVSGRGRLASVDLQLQRSFGNHGVQRLLQANEHELDDESRTSAHPRFAHDFSRIPVHDAKRTTNQERPPAIIPGRPIVGTALNSSSQALGAGRQALTASRSYHDFSAIPVHRYEGLEQLPAIQKQSLNVSNPADAAERQADEIARKVVEGQSVEIRGAHRPMKLAAMRSAENTVAFRSILENSKGRGESLDHSTKREMESKLGVDFSRVRIHTGRDAHDMNKSINAAAFTHGEDVYFKHGKYNPGSREGRVLLAHELVHAVQYHTGAVIGRQFDEETATQRIKGTENIKEFVLVDANGNQIEYDPADAVKGYVYLPEGTLVSKLDPNPQDPNQIHVIAWHNGKYREGYIHKSAFSGKYAGGSPFDVEVFIDDAYHTVHRAKLLLGEFKEELPRKAREHLSSILSDVDRDLTSYREGKIQITAEMLARIKKEDQEALMIDQSNKPGTIDRLSSAISQATNPFTSEQTRLSDTVLYVPLSDTWLQSDEELKTHYEKVMAENTNLGSRFVGRSGEGIEDPVFIQEWFSEFGTLRDIIKGRPAASSPEGNWLNTITPDVQKRIKRMIFLSGATWPEMAESPRRYAEGVAVSTSFGPLQANPLMLLLMHELNVNTDAGLSLMGEDSHIEPVDTKNAWESANKGEFSKTIANESDRLDDLFQAQSGIALTVLFRYLKKIKEMQ